MLQTLIQEVGAGYSAPLTNGETTHLVCSSILDTFGSVKYNCALSQGIHVVSYEWLLHGIAAGIGFRV